MQLIQSPSLRPMALSYGDSPVRVISVNRRILVIWSFPIFR